MKLTEQDALDFERGYPQPVTTATMGQAFGALKVEGECQRFAARTGLARSEVSLMVNRRTHRAYPQWTGAIPKSLETHEVFV
jgi:hypothetical protein